MLPLRFYVMSCLMFAVLCKDPVWSYFNGNDWVFKMRMCGSACRFRAYFPCLAAPVSRQMPAMKNNCQSFVCDQNRVKDQREDGLLTGADNKLALLITVFKVQSNWKKWLKLQFTHQRWEKKADWNVWVTAPYTPNYTEIYGLYTAVPVCGNAWRSLLASTMDVVSQKIWGWVGWSSGLWYIITFFFPVDDAKRMSSLQGGCKPTLHYLPTYHYLPTTSGGTHIGK